MLLFATMKCKHCTIFYFGSIQIVPCCHRILFLLFTTFIFRPHLFPVWSAKIVDIGVMPSNYLIYYEIFQLFNDKFEEDNERIGRKSDTFSLSYKCFKPIRQVTISAHDTFGTLTLVLQHNTSFRLFGEEVYICCCYIFHRTPDLDQYSFKVVEDEAKVCQMDNYFPVINLTLKLALTVSLLFLEIELIVFYSFLGFHFVEMDFIDRFSQY